MTISSPYNGDTDMMVTPDSTFDETSVTTLPMIHHPDNHPQQQNNNNNNNNNRNFSLTVVQVLEKLQSIWNRLDLQDFQPVFVSTTKRRLYLKDMVEIRFGGHAYYSLGGDDRVTFGTMFAHLERKVQEVFRNACANCLQDGRFLQASDMEAILQQARGKRQPMFGPSTHEWEQGADCMTGALPTVHGDFVAEQHRPLKRQRHATPTVSMHCW